MGKAPPAVPCVASPGSQDASDIGTPFPRRMWIQLVNSDSSGWLGGEMEQETVNG